MAPLEKYSRNDVKNHNDSSSTWIIIENKVYDVTRFLNEHPGGEEVILDEAGRDATKPFRNVGHSSEAVEMLKKYEIGEVIDSEKTKEGLTCPKILGVGCAIAVIAVGAMVAYRMYRASSN